MNALIQITTDAQGGSVVSARELHTFLGVKSKFADWFKNRADRYGFIENQDFVTLSKNLENGGRELDYALTLDCAKELAMVQSNQRGKQARQYFIDCEKQLRAIAELPAPTTSSVDPLVLQILQTQTQLMSGQQAQLDQLRADIRQIQMGRNRPRKPAPVTPPALPIPFPVDALTLRQKVNKQVNEYCGLAGRNQSDAYKYLYKRLLTVWGLDVYKLDRLKGESVLEALERYGCLDRLYSVVMGELNVPESL